MNKAIFWDLLGTLGGDSKTLIHDFTFFNESLKALKLAKENQFLNIVVTNQSHIAHGRLTMEEYNQGIERLKMELAKEQIFIEKFFTCPHSRADDCKCKKPKPALVYEAEKTFDIQLDRSFVVGDSGQNDMILAHNCGAMGVLVLTGEGQESLKDTEKNWKQRGPKLIAENSYDAVKKIVAYSF